MMVLTNPREGLRSALERKDDRRTYAIIVKERLKPGISSRILVQRNPNIFPSLHFVSLPRNTEFTLVVKSQQISRHLQCLIPVNVGIDRRAFDFIWQK